MPRKDPYRALCEGIERAVQENGCTIEAASEPCSRQNGPGQKSGPGVGGSPMPNHVPVQGGQAPD
jgi:hypothetical protein